MEYSELTPLDELGLQAGCRPHLASVPSFLVYRQGPCSGGLTTGPKHLKSVDAYLAEKQSQCGSVRTHGQETFGLIELSSGCGTPTLSGLVVAERAADIRRPTLQGRGRELWLALLRLLTNPYKISLSPNVK